MIQKPKGTLDIIEGSSKYRYVEEIFNSVCNLYNYKEIRTPIFERSELFSRSVGETSDIVNKEMYNFQDKAKREMSLRPEGTASLVRAYIENKLYANPDGPQKYYYIQPMFRYERPQKGRLRQFSQFGIEAMASNNPSLDAEVISMMVNTIKVLGLNGIVVKINTLGDDQTRDKYRDELKNYFRPHLNELCQDCQERFEKNPLRILDCKVDRKSELFNFIPKISDCLSDEAKLHFESLLELLDELEITYVIDDSLVRGLDYYSHTVFEIESTSKMGAQNVICAGGRYNKLVSELGGPETKCIGAAMGIDRLIIALENEEVEFDESDYIDTYILSIGEEAKRYSFKLSNQLRMSGFSTEINHDDKNMKSQFKKADRLNSKSIIIIGEEEVKSNVLNVKINGKETNVKTNDIIEFLDNEFSGDNNEKNT